MRLFAPNGFGPVGEIDSIRAVLSRGSFVPVSDVEEIEFQLQLHSAADGLSAISGEFVAFSMSAFESMFEVEREPRTRKSLAWPIIAAYYAAFFAAHAVMRFQGLACNWFSREDFVRLNEVARLHGKLTDSGPRRGQWRCQVASSGLLSFSHCGGGAKGGAHDEVWMEFRRFLDQSIQIISKTSLVPAVDIQGFALFLESLSEHIKRQPPAEVRNAVNYRRHYGVWFPYTGFQNGISAAHARKLNWRRRELTPLSSAGSDAAALLDFSQALAGLCVSAVDAAAKYFDRGSQRVRSGPLKLLNLGAS